MARDLWDTAFRLERQAARLRQKMRLQPTGGATELLRDRITHLEREALLTKAHAAAFPAQSPLPKVKRNWSKRK